MGIFKKAKKAVKASVKADVKLATRVGKGAASANKIISALKSGDSAKASEGLKGAIGKKAYTALIKKEHSMIGEKNSKIVARAGKTALLVGSAAYKASKGDLRGSKNSLGSAITTGVGRNNLRVAQHAGQDLIGKKNYNAIHKYGNRGLNTVLDVGSAIGAAERGDFSGAATYGGSAVRTAIGAKKLHEGKRALRDQIGQKNYDMLNNSYKAAKLGASIGQTASSLQTAHDEQKYMKMAKNAKKLYGQANEAHGLFQSIHSNANAGKITATSPAPTSSTTTTRMRPTAPIGGGGGGGMRKKPTTY